MAFQQYENSGYQYQQNPDGTYTVISPGGVQSTLTQAQVNQMAAQYNSGQPVSMPTGSQAGSPQITGYIPNNTPAAPNGSAFPGQQLTPGYQWYGQYQYKQNPDGSYSVLNPAGTLLDPATTQQLVNYAKEGYKPTADATFMGASGWNLPTPILSGGGASELGPGFGGTGQFQPQQTSYGQPQQSAGGPSPVYQGPSASNNSGMQGMMGMFGLPWLGGFGGMGAMSGSPGMSGYGNSLFGSLMGGFGGMGGGMYGFPGMSGWGSPFGSAMGALFQGASPWGLMNGGQSTSNSQPGATTWPTGQSSAFGSSNAWGGLNGTT